MRKPILSPKSYILAFLVITVFASTSITAINNFKIAKCDGTGYSDAYYLAYCRNSDDTSEAFGDYEHGLFYYGLDGESIANLRRADVVILGNSRTQDAFGSQALGDFFSANDLRHFLFGFAYGENFRFPQAMLERYGIRPRVIIVNVDEFFTDRTTAPWRRLRRNTLKTRIAYRYKTVQQAIHQWVCNGTSGQWLADQLCGAAKTIFRSRINGVWKRRNYWAEGDVPAWPIIVTHVSRQIARNTAWQLLPMARRFKERVVGPRTCLVFTSVPTSSPSSSYPPDIASSLAEMVGAYFVLPSPRGLRTFDGHHMTPASSELWGRRFAQGLAPVLKSCGVTERP